MRNLLALFSLCLISFYGMGQSSTISGILNDGENGEVLSYATIYLPGTSVGVTSNEYGFYALTLPDSLAKDGIFNVAFSFLGYATVVQQVKLGEHLKANVSLYYSASTMEEVIVTAERTRMQEELQSTEMSTVRMKMEEIKNLPAIAGETDIIKAAQLMPGISGGVEGSTGLFIRGGDADQNLVIIDEATVYNTGHLFGFMSVFNPDAISDMTIIKGAFPSNYGGRLSGILDIRQKEGDNQQFHGRGGIGLISSRLTLEGPIVKDKASFLIAGRRTYLDRVVALTGNELPYFFYDLNAKVNYKLSDNDRLYYSSYFGNDVLSFEQEANQEDSLDFGVDFGYKLGNYTNTLRWNHIYNDKLFSNISLVSTSFKYDINGTVGNNNIFIGSKVNDFGLKASYDYYKSNEERIKFGASFLTHYFRPNVISTAGDIAEFWQGSEGDQLLSHEVAIYAHDEKSFYNDKFKTQVGMRVSGSFVTGRQYGGLEPRMAVRYKLGEWDVLKGSYSRMRQYMHRVSSSTVALPTDLWYPVTASVRPQTADQIAVGYSHLFNAQSISVSIEGYYKTMDGLTEYREGANLILNDNFEAELLQGTGRSIGSEFLIRKEKGRLTGWVGYTLARTTRYFEELNQGVRFPAKYDRRHDLSTVLSYELTDRITFSAVWVYSSGARFTAQVGQHLYPNASLTEVEIIPIYSSRNAISMSPTHRLDINWVFAGKESKRWKNEWHIGGYNVYSRANPYRIDIVPNEDSLGFHYEQPGLFGFIFSVAYNFEF